MTSHGDDCYFFYYSTCAKGDSCPFRHCEAAMGNETVCSLWQEGRCFRTVCKFRHMEITKNRKEIPCYWENQPAGCQKPHCAFFHEKLRYIDGVIVPPNKSLCKNEEQPDEEPAPSPAAPIPSPANPQLRGVIKTETQEPVPSPTHPPVVINPADDDEDEDDQFSEEGEDGKLGISPRKLSKSGDSLNFGVSTLEEIRLRKALKASMKRAGYPIQSDNTSANGEKENIHLSYFQEPIFDFNEETGRPRPSVADRLGRKLPSAGKKTGDGFPLKRSLAERLGRVVAEEGSSVPLLKPLKPVKQRLGLAADAASPTQTAETNMESKKTPEKIYIKTLEEIRQEKATKNQSMDNTDGSSVLVSEISKTVNTKGEKQVKQAITVKDDSIGQIKMFTDLVSTKKRKQEKQITSLKDKHDVQTVPCKGQGELNTVGSGSEAANMGEVRVKTLEEIRKEKAARIQGQQTMEAGHKRRSETEENSAKRPRLLRINKLPCHSNITPENPESTEKPVKTCSTVPEKSCAYSNNIKVKTFDEIMQEKRLRNQKVENRTRTLSEAKPTDKRKAPAETSQTSPSSLSPFSNTPDVISSIQKSPIHKMIPLKSKAASPLNNFITPDTTTAAVATVTSVSVKHSEPENGESSREVPDKKTKKASALSFATNQDPTVDTIHNKNQKTSSECSTDTKVRPKLNVKPSVVKPAVHVKPGQKRKGAERSAVAAVKPLNSTSAVQEPLKDRQVFPSFSVDAQLSSAVPPTPSTLLDSGSNSSPLKEELQTVPVFQQCPSQEAKQVVSVAAPREACTVPQSPILKSPVQTPKTRRQSMSRNTSTSGAAVSNTAVDDFEELISEFADDHMEEDVDPGLGEDDLLQELSEMIDS